MSDINQQLIKLTQAGLPLVEKPYHELAEKLNISVEEVKDRFNTMLAEGKIRRIGVIPNHYKLGFVANGMTVWQVSEDDIDEIGTYMGALEFVSHCYSRPKHPPKWTYNLFAMIHAKTKNEVQDKIDIIREKLGDKVIKQDVLYSKKILKKTGMRI